MDIRSIRLDKRSVNRKGFNNHTKMQQNTWSTTKIQISNPEVNADYNLRSQEVPKNY